MAFNSVARVKVVMVQFKNTLWNIHSAVLLMRLAELEVVNYLLCLHMVVLWKGLVLKLFFLMEVH